MNPKYHASKVAELRHTIQKMTSELASLESMKIFSIYYQNGSVFRTFDLNAYTCDEERTFHAYKFLFEEKNLTQYEIGAMVYKWYTGKDKVSTVTIYTKWTVEDIAHNFSYAQFKSAIIKATKAESASIAQALINRF